MLTLDLNGAWTVRAVGDLAGVPAAVGGRDLPATVPGCIHTDLLAAGLIPDPCLDRNELQVQWIGRTDWEYRRGFDVAPALLRQGRVDLVCDGLDTIASLRLNGRPLGESANMHHPHRFDARGLLQPGRNELTVTFASAELHVRAMQSRFGYRPHVEQHPFNYIRKMACNFGWDWGPTLITCGLWRPIRLEAWSDVRVAAVRPRVLEAGSERARVAVHIDLEYAAAQPPPAPVRVGARLTGPGLNQPLAVEAGLDGQAPTAVLELTIDQPALWWPRGYGGQPLYLLEVGLTRGGTATEPEPAWSGRIGLRTVRLNTEADAYGSKFILEVNGKPVFCKGANWIPDDCFPHRVTAERYRRRIEQAADANMNMLRIWGGGIFEADAFYDLCDEMGLLVWQDFLFACAAYPEEEPFRGLVEAEARHNIARLCRHASLVIWNGCNENVWGYLDWGWKYLLAPLRRSWGLGYYTDLLPRLVAELDPARPYWPASPWSGSMDIHPLDDHHGNKHIWDAWNREDYATYRRHTPRFVSEFGWQGPPTWATLTQAIPPDQRWAGSQAMLHHQKARDGARKLRDRLVERFTVPPDDAAHFDDWLYLAQLSQARAVRAGVEWFRSRQPICMGTLYWQLNDCWPVTSWAAVDGGGRKKPLWYATRRFYADRILTFQPEPTGELCLHAVNDHDQPWPCRATVRRMRLDGTPLRECDVRVEVPPRSRARLEGAAAVLGPADDPSNEMLVADAVTGLAPSHPASGTARATWFFDIDRRLRYPPPAFDARLTPRTGGYDLTITASGLLVDLAVFPDRLDPQATVDDQLVTLLRGESVTFGIDTDQAMALADLTAPPVLNCANHYGQRG